MNTIFSKNIWAKLSALVLVGLLGAGQFASSAPVQAQDVTQDVTIANSIPKGWESYLDRPDILDSKVKIRTKVSENNWSHIRDAHFSFVAEVLEMYPNQEIYFLARDSELLYDAARLATNGTTEQNRIHLLNVSRANMAVEGIKSYLAEQGLTEKNLVRGKGVVFIDTGFAGTIPRVLSSYFSAEANTKIRTHLIVSSNKEHPSSRVFLNHLNRNIFNVYASELHGTIVSYEHMPRYSGRSSRFVFSGDRWHPISLISDSGSDGQVSKEQAVDYMSEIKTDWNRKETRARFGRLRNVFRTVLDTLRKNNPDVIYSELKEIIAANSADEAVIKAFLMDFNERTYGSNRVLAEYVATFSNYTMSSAAKGALNKFQLIELYPDWSKYIIDPVVGIPLLFKEKNWSILGAMLDAKLDIEISSHIFENLLKTSPKSAELSQLLLYFIDKQVTGAHQYNYKEMLELLSHKDAARNLDFIRALIENNKVNGADIVFEYLVGKSQKEIKTGKNIFDWIETAEQKQQLEDIFILAYNHSEHAKNIRDYVYLIDFYRNPKSAEYSKAIVHFLKNAQRIYFQPFETPHMQHRFDLLSVAVQNIRGHDIYQMRDATEFLGKLRTHPKGKFLYNALGMPIFQRGEYLAKNLPSNPTQSVKSQVAEPSPAVSKVKTITTPPVVKEEVPLSNITASLKVSDRIKVEKKLYSVLSVAGTGNRGVVFKVADSKGNVFALKVAKQLDEVTIQSFAKESLRIAQLEKNDISHSEILVKGKTFLLKRWVEGMRGDQVIEAYFAGNKSLAPAVEKLFELVARLEAEGLYVGDFRPPNLIWTGKEWTVIDSGSVQEGLSFEAVRAKWSEKFERRWKLKPPSAAKPMCRQLFSSAL